MKTAIVTGITVQNEAYLAKPLPKMTGHYSRLVDGNSPFWPFCVCQVGISEADRRRNSQALNLVG